MTDEAQKLVLSALIDADHLAECAERLLAALNKVAGAEERCEAFEGAGAWTVLAEIEKAKELRSEYWTAVKTAAGEYRHRAVRARAALAPPQEGKS